MKYLDRWLLNDCIVADNGTGLVVNFEGTAITLYFEEDGDERRKRLDAGESPVGWSDSKGRNVLEDGWDVPNLDELIIPCVKVEDLEKVYDALRALEGPVHVDIVDWSKDGSCTIAADAGDPESPCISIRTMDDNKWDVYSIDGVGMLSAPDAVAWIREYGQSVIWQHMVDTGAVSWAVQYPDYMMPFASETAAKAAARMGLRCGKSTRVVLIDPQTNEVRYEVWKPTHEEIETVSRVSLNGKSLCINLTRELREMGIGLGEPVRVRIRRA